MNGASGPHPPADRCHSSQAGRAGHRSAFHALAVALAASAPGTQVQGERATLDVIRQLQGFEIPANAWERHVLARRISNYDPGMARPALSDRSSGMGRLSPHPATLEDSAAGKRRVIPTSVAPITFFVREEADWMTPHHPAADSAETRGLGEGAKQVLDFLRHRGASFFADIVRGANLLKAEVETALWELVAAGIVTADGFDNLRSLIDPKRRSGQGSGRSARPRHSAGRWACCTRTKMPTGIKPSRPPAGCC